MKRYFITGTDTDCGKSYVTRHLLQKRLDSGKNSIALKPVACGVIDSPFGKINEDVLHYKNILGDRLSIDEINPFCFEPFIAPEYAANKENKILRVADIVEKCENTLSKHTPDVCFIEGAGGWHVPLNKTETMIDLVKALKADVILVVGMTLGCLNHTLLTVDAIERSGCTLAGWIANQIDPKMISFDENLATLKTRIKAPLIDHVSYNCAVFSPDIAKQLSGIQEL